MKKLVVVFFASIIGIVALGGCSNNSVIDDSEWNTAKKTGKFEIQITSAELVDNNLNTDIGHETLRLALKAKNISKEAAPIGSGDFYLKDKDGKKYTFTGSESSLGDVVKAGKTIEGYGYYSIPKESKKMMVVYKPFQSTDQLKWEITIPGKK
ncbi:DUF4352 domain-containing protein [Listeria sp. SHR_NRA_18]|uniref:DUF4352 domain-containing protein n=1 Tax=Listeria sp. SHR_NRA_18 TaxID=2269046 RepID=UPI001F1ABC31|nr:DUF4352 domain-containing protein [Listeria sp. SHR_NRA_18]